MKQRTVIISGANGFIGSHLASVMEKNGLGVVRLARKATAIREGGNFRTGKLGEPLAEEVFHESPIDCFVHCAYDQGAPQVNHAGTVLWAEQAEANGVPLQIYISSISAREGPQHSYGALKHKTEQWMVRQGHVILRPGLVIGVGGLFDRMVRAVTRIPVIPLIDNGRNRVHLTSMEMLARIVVSIISDPGAVESGSVWNLQQASPVTLRELLAEIKKQHGARTLFLPIPYHVAEWGLRLISGFGLIPTPFKLDSLRGLRLNARLDLPSHLAQFGEEELSLHQIVAEGMNRR